MRSSRNKGASPGRYGHRAPQSIIAALFTRKAGDASSILLEHPWLRINRVLRVMLHTHWSAEAWSQVRVEVKRALALRSEIQRAGRSTDVGFLGLR